MTTRMLRGGIGNDTIDLNALLNGQHHRNGVAETNPGGALPTGGTIEDTTKGSGPKETTMKIELTSAELAGLKANETKYGALSLTQWVEVLAGAKKVPEGAEVAEELITEHGLKVRLVENRRSNVVKLFGRIFEATIETKAEEAAESLPPPLPPPADPIVPTKVEPTVALPGPAKAVVTQADLMAMLEGGSETPIVRPTAAITNNELLSILDGPSSTGGKTEVKPRDKRFDKIDRLPEQFRRQLTKKQRNLNVLSGCLFTGAGGYPRDHFRSYLKTVKIDTGPIMFDAMSEWFWRFRQTVVIRRRQGPREPIERYAFAQSAKRIKHMPFIYDDEKKGFRQMNLSELKISQKKMKEMLLKTLVAIMRDPDKSLKTIAGGLLPTQMATLAAQKASGGKKWKTGDRFPITDATGQPVLDRHGKPSYLVVWQYLKGVRSIPEMIADAIAAKEIVPEHLYANAAKAETFRKAVADAVEVARKGHYEASEDEKFDEALEADLADDLDLED